MEKIEFVPNDKIGTAVSARSLYKFLEIKDHFTQWIDRMFVYGFSENVDYQAIKEFVSHTNGLGGTFKIDYALTLSMAKKIASMQRSEKGKLARDYFFDNEHAPNTSVEDMIIKSSQNIILAVQEIVEAKKRVALLEIDNEVNKDEIEITKGRLNIVEDKVNDIIFEKEVALDELNEIALSNVELPEESLRSKIVRIVNNYSRIKNIQQQEIWKKIYSELYYRYRVSLNNYKKQSKSENLLDVAERNNHLDKIFAIASNLFVKKEIQLA